MLTKKQYKETGDKIAEKAYDIYELLMKMRGTSFKLNINEYETIEIEVKGHVAEQKTLH